MGTEASPGLPWGHLKRDWPKDESRAGLPWAGGCRDALGCLGGHAPVTDKVALPASRAVEALSKPDGEPHGPKLCSQSAPRRPGKPGHQGPHPTSPTTPSGEGSWGGVQCSQTTRDSPVHPHIGELPVHLRSMCWGWSLKQGP